MKGLPKIDFKKVAMQTAGEAGGLFALNMLSTKVKFVREAKPGLKGIIYKALGTIVLPMLAGKAKKGNELIEGAASTLSVAGTSQLMNAFMPGKVASIGGYEDSPISGPGYEFDENDGDGVDGPNDEDGEDVMS
jgi:hypothetical protein